MVDTGKVAQFIIGMKECHREVGSVYLRDIDRLHERAELGIFLGEEDCLGIGIGRNAIRLALRYAFEDEHLHKVMLRVLAENQRARACYRRAGFCEEGVFREHVKIDGAFRDVIFMAVLKGDSQDT